MGLSAWLLAALAGGAQAAEDTNSVKPIIAPPAGWVRPQFYDHQSVQLEPDPTADQHWLLLERQINAADDETFLHCVRQITSVAGVQNGSDLKIDFNPSYQTLSLHWARLWRGTNHLERLDAEKIRMVRQERDLDQQVLNGEQTAMLVMDDVRVGDIVDYAYTVKGANPVFNGRFSTTMSSQLDQPVERLLTRVLWPARRRFYLKSHGSETQPVVLTKSNSVECVWDARHLPAYHQEDSLPIWCDPEPWVQISEFKTWLEVNQWALALFQNNSQPSPELAKIIAGWKSLPTQEEQAQDVLRFVQDQIRYFGVEIGVSAEKPADPATVFSRRFGDCKDKALLFVSLLRQLGIEAYPVLVNTAYRSTIEEWQPAADAFDHCIAAVVLDGQTYWLDPTAGYQRGPLAMHYLPNYGRGLVISPRTTGLSVIPQTAGLPQTTTTEYFTLGGKAGASDLKVVTVALGRDADVLREMFATTKRADIEKNDTHFYSDLYPGIHQTSPVVLEDDEQADRVQTTESYTIDNIWTKSDKDGKYRCDFYPYAVSALVKKPVDLARTLPLAVDFPSHQVLRTEITLPEAWQPEHEDKNIADPAFTYRKASRLAGNTFVMEYEYQSLADCVSPERTDEYLKKVGDLSKSLGYTLIWR